MCSITYTPGAATIFSWLQHSIHVGTCVQGFAESLQTIIIIMEYMTIGRYGPIVHNSFNSLSGMRTNRGDSRLTYIAHMADFVGAQPIPGIKAGLSFSL